MKRRRSPLATLFKPARLMRRSIESIDQRGDAADSALSRVAGGPALQTRLSTVPDVPK